MKIYKLGIITSILKATTVLSGNGGGGGGGGGGPPPVSHVPNRLSYPMIIAEGPPSDFLGIVSSGFRFADLTAEVCQEEPPVPVPDTEVCFLHDGTTYWLSQRVENVWQAYAPQASGSVYVTHIDVGDKLESAVHGPITGKVVRTEIILYLDATKPTSTEFSGDVLDPYAIGFQDYTFQAFPMSPPVPGTEQSIDEIKGTNFPSNLDGAWSPGVTVDPNLFFGSPVPYHATVYTECLGLIIQKIDLTAGSVSWNPSLGEWEGDGATSLFSANERMTGETNASGLKIFGFNWPTKDIDNAVRAGTWRITFWLDQRYCPDGTILNTSFEEAEITNIPEAPQAVLMTPADGAGGGGLVYIDVVLALSGTGGGGGGNGGHLRH